MTYNLEGNEWNEVEKSTFKKLMEFYDSLSIPEMGVLAEGKVVRAVAEWRAKQWNRGRNT